MNTPETSQASTVNRMVAGSSPARGATLTFQIRPQTPKNTSIKSLGGDPLSRSFPDGSLTCSAAGIDASAAKRQAKIDRSEVVADTFEAIASELLKKKRLEGNAAPTRKLGVGVRHREKLRGGENETRTSHRPQLINSSVVECGTNTRQGADEGPSQKRKRAARRPCRSSRSPSEVRNFLPYAGGSPPHSSGPSPPPIAHINGNSAVWLSMTNM